MASDNGVIVWTCYGCGKQVLNGEGFICIDMEKVQKAEEAADEFRAEHPEGYDLHDLLNNYPEAVKWRVYHNDCDPDPEERTNLYSLTLREAQTHAELLRWTAHMMGKRWLGRTDWDSVIRRAATPTP